MINFLKKSKISLSSIIVFSIMWIYSSVIAGKEMLNNSEYISYNFSDMDPGLGIVLGSSTIFIIPFCLIGIGVLINIYLLFKFIIISEKVHLFVSVCSFIISIYLVFHVVYGSIINTIDYYSWKLYWSMAADIIFLFMILIAILDLIISLYRKIKRKIH